MGTIRKIGDYFYIEFDARGLKYQRIGGTNKKAAECLLKEIEDKIQKGEMSIVVCNVETRDFFKNFLKFIKNDNEPRTYVRYEFLTQHFQEFVQTALSPACHLSQITPSVIEEYRTVLFKSIGKTGWVLGPKVINFTLYLLRDIFNHAINLGHINDNPTLHTQLIEIPNRNIPHTLSDKDVRKLLDVSSSSMKDIIEVLLRTGMRIEELIGLKWTNVDFNDNCLKIELLIDDYRRGRQVPMDSEALAVIRQLCGQKDKHQEYVFIDENGQNLKKEKILGNCIKAGQKIGIQNKSMQSIFRNTFARRVLGKGVSLIELNKLLGFGDIARVMRYEGFMK